MSSDPAGMPPAAASSSSSSSSASASASPGSAGAPAATAAADLEPWLRAILRCPACRGELRDAGSELACSGPECGLVYRIEDGIPVLLVDEARRPA